MTFTKAIRNSRGRYWGIVKAWYNGRWLFTRVASLTGELEIFTVPTSCEEQAQYLLSKVPDSFPLNEYEQDRLNSCHENEYSSR